MNADDRAPIDDDLRAAYLRRLGLDPEPPSADALRRLHQRHVERVPYETLWIQAGEGWGTDPADSVARIAHEGRGGYCFHLNGAFSELLRSLGYGVRRHVGGVHGPEGPNVDALTNHLVLTVVGLPTDDNPGGTWYVDAGLGDALHDPIPLIAGAYLQAPYALSIERTDDGVGDWHLTHDPTGSFVGMSWRTADASMAEFTPRHQWLSTDPESGFVRLASIQRRDATGVDIMRGLVLTRRGDGGAPTEPLTERDDWFAAVAEVLQVGVDSMSPEHRDILWARVHADHQSWVDAGAP